MRSPHEMIAPTPHIVENTTADCAMEVQVTKSLGRAERGASLNLDLHKELYFFEWNRKEQLASAANLPVALLTVLAGGVLFLVQSFPYSADLATALFITLAAGSAASQVCGVYFLIRSLYGYWYEQIPAPDKLQGYFEELAQYHESVRSEDDEIQRDFDSYLQQRLAEATVANRENNTRTAGALHKATGSIVFALVFAGLSFVPYLPASLNREQPTPKVQIEGPVNLRSEATHVPENNPQGGQSQQSQSQQDSQQQPASPPPKPQGPANEQVRKGGETREKR